MSRFVVYQGFYQYDAVNIFARELADGLIAAGCEIDWVDARDTGNIDERVETVFSKPCDGVISFNGIGAHLQQDGQSLYDVIGTTFYAILLDHPSHHVARLKGIRNLHVLDYDRSHLRYLRRVLGETVPLSFLPHAGSVCPRVFAERDIDVLFAGTFLNPTEWHQRLLEIPDQELSQLMRSTADLCLLRNTEPLEEVFAEVCASKGVDLPADPHAYQEMSRHLATVDVFVKAVKRQGVLKELDKAGISVEIYGNNWTANLFENHHLHPAVGYPETLELMARSRVLLNMGYVPEGSHERVFSGMLNGALVVTDENPYFQKLNREGDVLLTYEWNHHAELPGRLEGILNNPSDREQIVTRAKALAESKHKWANRADELLTIMSETTDQEAPKGSHASGPSADTAPLVSVLCFSKDRPMQVDGYIKSLIKHSSMPLDISILYAAGNGEFAGAYRELQHAHPDVTFIEETNFRRQVTRWVKQVETPLVMFGCDDVVFNDDFDVQVIGATMANPDVHAFSLRLGLNITYCAMHRTVAERPVFTRDGGCLYWNWQDERTEHDWDAVFELCATIYRRDLLNDIIDALNADKFRHPHWQDRPDVHWGHPNRFEPFGVVAAKALSQASQMACFAQSKCLLVTVNRVQDECENFVYSPGDELGVEQLFELWNSGYEVAVDAYCGRLYQAIQMGELLLSNDGGKTVETLGEYDIFKVMIKDYVDRVVAFGHALATDERFPDFVVQFDRYFHMPGAERGWLINVVPSLSGAAKNGDFPSLITARNAWLKERVGGMEKDRVGCLSPEADLPDLLSETGLDVDLLTFGDEWRLKGEADTYDAIFSCSLLEHFGLGRSGEPLDPLGTMKAIGQLANLVKPGGSLILVFPVGAEAAVLFNQMRVFERELLLAMLPAGEVIDEAYISNAGNLESAPNNLRDYESYLWCVHWRLSE